MHQVAFYGSQHPGDPMKSPGLGFLICVPPLPLCFCVAKEAAPRDVFPGSRDCWWVAGSAQ